MSLARCIQIFLFLVRYLEISSKANQFFKRNMKRILQCFMIAGLLAYAILASAQTAPGWTTGFVPTAAQWNAEWASKADVTSTAVNFAGGNINGTTLGGTTPAPGSFTTLSANNSVVGVGFQSLFASPYPIGGTAPSTGAFTALSATGAVSLSGTISGAALTSYLTAPAPIGSTTQSTGAFTTLSASSTVSGAGFSTYLASPPAIGGTAAAGGSFTTLSASSTVSGSGFSTYLASPPAIGGTAASTGAFTSLTSTRNFVVTTGRAINTGTTSDTIGAFATTYESSNTASGAFTVVMGAPTGDGDRRRICFKNLTGTITWTQTAPANAIVGVPSTMAAGSCIELIYNSVAGSPTNSAATTWYI